MAQLLQGLDYLSLQPQKIIHYDLKPGNLLYNHGEIKITDFGLSKIMTNSEDTQIELTSQGAGTYWYLPPECFRMDQVVMISQKVDIWSAGVIFFQMLFGKRPFGDEFSQDKFFRQSSTILNTQQVIFPDRIKVSDEAKDLIQKCLSPNPRERPFAKQILQKHPFFTKIRK